VTLSAKKGTEVISIRENTSVPFLLLLLLFFSILTLWVRERWALSFFQTGVFLLGIVWAGRMIVRPTPLRGSLLLIPFGGAILWGLLQLLAGTTVYRFDTWNAVLFWTTGFVLFFLSLQVLQTAEIRRAFLRGLLYFGFAITVISVIQLFTSEGKVFWVFPTRYQDKVLGPFVYHNNYAAYIELLLPLALVEALRDRRRALTHTAMAAVMLASVIASASRAGSVLVVLEVVVILLLALARGMFSGRDLGITTAKMLLFVVIFSGVVGWGLLWERLQHPDPFIYRREMLASSLAMARERPWLGFGLGTYQTAYPAHALFDIGLIVNHAHNDWAEWLAEGGVPFLLMLLSVAVWTVRPAVRSLWGVGLLSVFVHAFVDYPMQRLGLAAWVFVLLGALVARESQLTDRDPPARVQKPSIP
jgi:O-antigen ligase